MRLCRSGPRINAPSTIWKTRLPLRRIAMSFFLIITAVVTLFAAVIAMSLRNLVHCALMLAVSFSGVAAIYLQLNAEFVGFTEILVYVGAVAILIVMAILLTRSGETPDKTVLTS